MADLEDLDLTAPADSLYSGGVKINLIRTRVDALYTVLSSITSAEADQIEAIGTSTISAAQWGYLGACGAGGGQLLAALTASESTQLEAIGTTTISAAQWGYLGACVAGGGQLLAALTAAESTQLEAIGTTTISAAQWAYVGALNQGLTTTSTVTFGTINAFTLGGKLTAGAVEIEGSAFDINGGTIDGITSLTAGGALDIGAYGFRAATLTADGLTATRVVFAGANGLLSDAAAMTFVTDTLTVTKLGAFQAAGAINFDSQNMTNVDIDSGTIGGVTLDGAIAGGDQAFTGVGDMTFTAGSLLRSGVTGADTLLLAANDTTFITLTTGTPDTLGIGAFTLSGKLTGGASEIEGSAFDINGGTIASVTLDGAIAGGDQAFTNVGDMTFAAASILKSGSTNTNTLLLAANDTTFITLTTADPDTCAISGAAIDNCIIGAGTPAALTCTTFTSTGIDDNADATAITISSAEVVSLGAAKLTVGATTPTAAQWGYVGALTTHPLGADGTAGRIPHGILFLIQDGTDDSTLKCTVYDAWNGVAVAVTDNIAKNATTGDFSLSDTGGDFTLDVASLSGNCLFAMSALYGNGTSVYYTALGYASGNDILINVYSGNGTKQDITAVVDAGDLRLQAFYITDA